MAGPLTKKKKNGELYVRPQKIEDEIIRAQSQDLPRLVRRAAITSAKSADFLPLECLVHLIRDGLRSGDHDRMNSLMPRLLTRCETILKNKIPPELVPIADNLSAEIIGDFAVLFAEDSSDSLQRLDFFECRFNLAFLTFRTPYISRAQAERVERVVQNEDLDERTQDEFLSELAIKWGQHDGMDRIAREELRAAVDALPADQRKAVTLVYLLGVPEESNDPLVKSAATLCGVSGRAIRYRLTKALETLSAKFKSKE